MTSTKEYTKYLPSEPGRFEGRHLEELLIYVNKLNASDVTIQTNESIFAEIYGKLYRISKRRLTNTEVSELINELYGPNGTTQLMRGIDLDTHYEIRPTRHERYRHRINAVGCYVAGHEGIQITIRTIPSTPPLLSTMELPDEVVEASAPNDGIIYITGATGSGKSTLLASMIRHLAEDPEAHRKILTYESPIEFVYDMIEKPTSVVCQSEVPRHLPNFADGVRNALRRKPHLILVGEARDQETISASLEAALTGHPVFTTLHTNGVAETIRRLVGTFSQEERAGRTIDIIETMRMIIWQRLVPSVDNKRVALREYLVFNENIRDQLLDCDTNEITAEVRKLLYQYGKPMHLDIEDKYQKGLINDRTYKLLKARYQDEKNEQ